MVLILASAVPLQAAEFGKLRLSNTLSTSFSLAPAVSENPDVAAHEILQQKPESMQIAVANMPAKSDVQLPSVQVIESAYTQTTLNKPTGKFKFNVMTDDMIGSLNSIMQPTIGVNEMPVDVFHVLIATAVNRHPELRSVGEQAKIAGFASSEAFSAYFPQVTAFTDVSSVMSRSETSSGMAPKGDGIDASLNLKQLLYDFGATGANYDAVKFREQATKERVAFKRSELGFRTISAYLELLRARLLYKHAQDNYDSRLSIVNMLKERYALGGGSKVDVIRAEARLTDASSAKVSANISLQMAQASYKEMFNEEPAKTPLPQDVSIDLANQSIDEMTKRFGAVRETEMGLRGLQADAKAAAFRMLPTLSFEMTGARRDQGTYYGSYYESSAHLVMRYNLFAGGQESDRKEQAVHRAEQMQQDLDNLILQVKRNIVQSAAQVNEAESLLRARREGVLGASESLLAVKEHFAYRRGTLLDLLRSQEELYIAGRDYISAMIDRSIARYRLLHLTAALETLIPEISNQ